MKRRGLLAGVIATVAAIAAMAPSALAADVPHYTTDRQDVPAEYRTFVLDTTDLPTQIVNGDFQTFGNEIIDIKEDTVQWLPWQTFVDRDGMVWQSPAAGIWSPFDGWDRDLFGWRSDDAAAGHEGVVELQRNTGSKDGSRGNVWAEICAHSVDSYIYQDVATTPGAVYTWHLDHAARNAGTPDSMQVMIGAPGHETPQQATRVASNDPADTVGETGMTITTHGTGQNDGWSTYEGVYVATSTVTRFTFKAVTGQEAYGSAEGNLIDNIGFEISWPLTYDLQGGTGIIPNKED